MDYSSLNDKSSTTNNVLCKERTLTGYATADGKQESTSEQFLHRPSLAAGGSVEIWNMRLTSSIRR